MNINTAKQQLRTLLNDKGYKKYLYIGAASWTLLALISSFLFVIIVGLLKLALLIIGLAAFGYAGYILYPTFRKKYDEEIAKKI